MSILWGLNMKPSGIGLLVAVFLGVAVTFSAEAQQPGTMPRIGFLQTTQNENATAFNQALRDAGYVDGQSVRLESRFYAAQVDKLPALVNELVGLRCDVIVAAGPYAIRTTIGATQTIPVVGIDLESDPVASGWARSLRRPGGNLTGLFLDLPELGGKQIQLLREVVPGLARVGVLWDSNVGETQFRATEAAARAAGVSVESLAVQRVEDLRDAFGRASSDRLKGVVVLTSPLIYNQRSQIATLALNSRIPTISLFTLFPASGGLMAYGPDFTDMFKRPVAYVERILKGAKVGELPIERPSRFELVVNVKTARTLGLTIPPALLARTDRVIQ